MGRMPAERKPLFGAILLSTFITACLGWLFHGIGDPVPWWGYPLIFVIFAGWIYTVGRLLMRDDSSGGRARSIDISIEG